MVITDEIRAACEWVSERARQVTVNAGAIPQYAASLPTPESPAPAQRLSGAEREREAAYWLTLDAVNFGSGWFPTLRKRMEPTGYRTVAAGIRRRFERDGPWSVAELSSVTATELAGLMDQDPDHELMALFAGSLADLGAQMRHAGLGSFAELADGASGSAVALVERLSRWPCFADTSLYEGRQVPFLKRAQIAAADLARAGVAEFRDLQRLTLFADNLVPHVLRLDGILDFEAGLAERIERGELIAHGSPEEVEIRACAVHAVELIVAAGGPAGPATAAQIDQLLWNRGQGAAYKAVPRPRSRSTAY